MWHNAIFFCYTHDLEKDNLIAFNTHKFNWAPTVCNYQIVNNIKAKYLQNYIKKILLTLFCHTYDDAITKLLISENLGKDNQ